MCDAAQEFLGISDLRSLANYLGVPYKDLTMLAYGKLQRRYTTFRIPKRNGKSRCIDAPNPYLMKVQRRLKEAFDSVYKRPSCVYGFARGLGIASNASQHVRKAAILSVDLEDFFPTITANRVYGMLKSDPFGFPKEVASCITELVCYNKRLPQGAPTSPVLSNIICLRLDKQLLSYAHEKGVYYTRYADDLTFSARSNRKIQGIARYADDGLVELDERLVEIIDKNGFVVNQAKLHIAYQAERQVVTGIVTNCKCNFVRAEYRSLRVLFDQWAKMGVVIAGMEYVKVYPEYATKVLNEHGEVDERALIRHIRGRLDFYTMVCAQNPAVSDPLRRLWTMYFQQTKRPVPMILPEFALLGTECMYDYNDANGTQRIFAAEGTAFITKKGILLTCNHCMADFGISEVPASAYIQLKHGPGPDSFLVSDCKRNESLDIAAVRIDELFSSFPRLELDECWLPQVGDIVVGYGYAAARDVARQIAGEVVEVYGNGSHVRIHAPFITGMSGGPVFNRRGKVVGVITRGSTPDDYSHDGEYVTAKAIVCWLNEGCDANGGIIET